MSEPLKKTYADYLGLGYQVVSGYYAEGFHFQVLQSNEDVVIAQISHTNVVAGGFIRDADVQITRVVK